MHFGFGFFAGGLRWCVLATFFLWRALAVGLAVVASARARESPASAQSFHARREPPASLPPLAAALATDSESGGASPAPQIGVDDDLVFVTQIHRVEPGELLAPFLRMAYINLEAAEEVR